MGLDKCQTGLNGVKQEKCLAPCLKGKGHSILILHGVLQGVLKDILYSREESRDDFWLQEWQVKTLIKLSEKLQASWCTGRGKSPMILHSVPQGVFENILDSWMDPRWLSMSRMTCIKLRKLCAKFQFPPCTGRGHSPGSLQSVLQGVLEDALHFSHCICCQAQFQLASSA